MKRKPKEIKRNKDFVLTKTQYFLRFLKKHNIYNDYIKELNDRGRSRWQNALTASRTNPCQYLTGMNMNEAFWIQMMDWADYSQYNKNGHNVDFWKEIDNHWTTIWGKHREEQSDKILLNNDDMFELTTFCQLPHLKDEGLAIMY